jgi:hypothetical protein
MLLIALIEAEGGSILGNSMTNARPVFKAHGGISVRNYSQRRKLSFA